ncbi:hypothetical protein CKAH01_01508 [Colletotrichum kahawae]|uniref:Uncharacterized protein n=1 Tax=Colletotrichum kahawae TaxID=34407 RepID=A0AAD9Y7M1_COLKA|nr:hypothetical protein CKAH01_01508 [Colletotrichum kahawae]
MVGARGPDEFATHAWSPPKRFLHFVLPVMLPPPLVLLLRVSFKLWPDAQTMYVRQREDLSFKSGLVYGIRLSTPWYNLILTTHLQEIFWHALKFNHPHPTANAVLPLRPFAQNPRHGQESVCLHTALSSSSSSSSSRRRRTGKMSRMRASPGSPSLSPTN